jgi:hypothetical protein
VSSTVLQAGFSALQFGCTPCRAGCHKHLTS